MQYVDATSGCTAYTHYVPQAAQVAPPPVIVPAPPTNEFDAVMQQLQADDLQRATDITLDWDELLKPPSAPLSPGEHGHDRIIHLLLNVIKIEPFFFAGLFEMGSVDDIQQQTNVQPERNSGLPSQF
jgi:hypothetical protein